MLLGHEKSVRSVAWFPDSGYIASGSQDKTVRLWDVNTGEELARVGEHGDGVRSVAFSPSGMQLASASQDGTVGLWDVSDLVRPAPGKLSPELMAVLTRQLATIGLKPATSPRPRPAIG